MVAKDLLNSKTYLYLFLTLLGFVFRIVFDYLYGENMCKGKFISHSEGGIKMLKGGLKFCVCVCVCVRGALKNRW